MPVTVAEIMTRKVVSVELDDKLEDVKQIFDNVRFHHLMVVENGRLFGVLSDRDLLKHLSPFIDTASEQPRDRATLNKRVHQIMSRKLVTAGPELSAIEGARLMARHSISCLPIVGPKGEILGVVTLKDILYAISGVAQPETR